MIAFIYEALKFLGLILPLVEEHEARAKAQEIANDRPLTLQEELDDIDKLPGR